MTHNTILSLNRQYSTTRLVTIEKPLIINNPEDKFKTVLFLPEGEGRKGEGGLRTKGYFKSNYTKLNGKWYMTDFNDNVLKQVDLPDEIAKETDMLPLISVVTVVLNGEKYLEETIQSVITQTYSNVEYIVIDGGSTDGTLDIIKKYEDTIDYWVSEKDRGIYDAMNKGLEVVLGSIIGIINSGDKFADENIFTNIFMNIKNDIMVYYGKMIVVNPETGNHIELRIPKLWKMYFGMYLNHPSTFVSKKAYLKIGNFNSKEFKLAADYDFLLRCEISGLKFLYINKVITYMRDGGISIQRLQDTKKEDYIIRKKNLNPIVFYIVISIKKIKRLLNIIIKKAN